MQPDALLDRKLFDARLEAAFDALPERAATALRLRWRDELSYAEIAEAMVPGVEQFADRHLRQAVELFDDDRHQAAGHLGVIRLGTPARLRRDRVALVSPLIGDRDQLVSHLRNDIDYGNATRLYDAIDEAAGTLHGIDGRRVVVLIDEAHAMPDETLEQVRLLSNLETSRHKLLQIVLFGQPELDTALARPSLRQLKDRITHSFRMRPLSEPEVARYLSFRMRAAGYRGPDVFTPKAVALIARASDGLTRRINILADKSLLSAFSADTHAITARHARAGCRGGGEAGASRSPSRAIARVARERGARHVVVVVPARPRWRRVIAGELIRELGRRVASGTAIEAVSP